MWSNHAKSLLLLLNVFNIFHARVTSNMQCTLGTIQDGGRKKNGNILISYTNWGITKELLYN